MENEPTQDVQDDSNDLNVPERSDEDSEEVVNEDLAATEVLDNLEEILHNTVEDELRAKIEFLTASNIVAATLFSKILKGYTFNDQIKQWLELNRVRE